MDDAASLLRRYVEEKSDAAFTELVRRQLDLVYASALRRLGGDAHAAADVAQQVFTKLAREAPRLASHPALAAWLYLTTRHAALDWQRAARRRRTREQQALAMQDDAPSPTAAPDAATLRPLLDAALDKLADADRTAVVLRYFEQRPFADIGVALRMSEDAARIRTDRALEKLRALLARRGVTSTAAALGLALEQSAAVAAPAGLAGTIASTALVGAVSGGGAAASAGAGLLLFMSTNSIAPAVAAVAALVAVGAAFYNVSAQRSAEADLATARAEMAALNRMPRRTSTAATPRASATSTPTSPAPDSMAARESAAEAFLEAHPEAREILQRSIRRTLEQRLGPGLQALGLSPAEQERIVQGVAPHYSGGFGIGSFMFRVGPEPARALDAPGGILQELLGDEAYQRFGEFTRKEKTRSPIRALTLALSGSDTPLQPPQAQALMDLIDRHTVERGRGGGYVMMDLKWPQILEQAAGVLSASQLAAFRIVSARESPIGALQPAPTP